MALVQLPTVDDAITALVQLHNYQLSETSHLRSVSAWRADSSQQTVQSVPRTFAQFSLVEFFPVTE